MHASQEESVRLAQESAFRRLKEATYTAEADEVIEGKLNILEKEIKSWAKRYARKSEEPPELEASSSEILRRSLKSLSTFGDELGDTLAKPWSDQRSMNRVLAAMISTAIYGRVAAQPFFFMTFRRRCEMPTQSQDGPELQDRGDDLGLSKLYREFLASMYPDETLYWPWADKDNSQMINKPLVHGELTLYACSVQEYRLMRKKRSLKAQNGPEKTLPRHEQALISTWRSKSSNLR